MRGVDGDGEAKGRATQVEKSDERVDGFSCVDFFVASRTEKLMKMLVFGCDQRTEVITAHEFLKELFQEGIWKGGEA